MDRFEQLNEFIERAQKLTLIQAQDNTAEEYRKRKAYYTEKYSQIHWKLKLRESQRKYNQTPKGKKQRKMRGTYQAWVRQKSSRRVPKEELQKMRLFYLNRPEGCQIDHIIPLACGGLHSLENLQYLSGTLNQRKYRCYVPLDMKIQLLRNRFIRKL